MIDVLVGTGFVQITRLILPGKQRIDRRLLQQREDPRLPSYLSASRCINHRIDCDLTFNFGLPRHGRIDRCRANREFRLFRPTSTRL